MTASAINPGRTVRPPSVMLTVAIRPSIIASALVGALGVDQLILWRFLGFGSLAVHLAASLALACLCVAMARARGWAADRAPTVRLLLVCLALSTFLYLLGGQGRFFYANTDWQVRDAVLRDLVAYPWPFVYTVGDVGPRLLRVPAGMYLFPALVGKLAGYRVAEFALLGQNALFLTALLGLGSTLFATTRTRLIALGVFLGFSGMDVIGQYLVGDRLDGHLEWWSPAQFSSHVTQAFWVPQHAMAGWTAAILFLLWRDGRVPLVGLLAPLPLLALWSPLPLIGMAPFAAWAGLKTLASGRLTPDAILLPAGATLLSVPGLLYLSAGSDAVSGGVAPLTWPAYVVGQGLEALPFVFAAAALGWRDRFGGAVLAIVAGVLAIAPWIQVGNMIDFAMRATIPALAILSIQIADILARGPRPADVPGSGNDRRWTGFLLCVLAIGAVTPLSEIRRALVYPTSPSPLCSYFGIVPGGAATYVAPLDRLPKLVAPADPARIRPLDPATCWATPWREP